jgi:prepilin-type N-terminal cleavage/methylation domain-containing protein
VTCRAFTLIEVLAAAALLGLVAAGAMAWTTGGLKLLKTARSASGPALWVERTIDAIARDLDEAARASLAVDPETHTLTVRTAHAAAGGAPGWREVRWSHDPSRGRLIRSERRIGETSWQSSVVLSGVEAWLVALDDKQATLTVTVRFPGLERNLHREIAP